MNKLEMTGRKWAIFESAVYLFAKYGYENVSMRELAAKNDIRAASLYNHFPSKESLLELMFEFYSVNIVETAPDLQAVLDSIPYLGASEVLYRCMTFFGEELQPIMDCIYQIALTQASHDPTAYELIWTKTFVHSKTFVGSVVEEMVTQGKIEPMDIDTFTTLYTSFAFTCAFRNHSKNPIGGENWIKGLDMLFSLAKDRQAN